MPIKKPNKSVSGEASSLSTTHSKKKTLDRKAMQSYSGDKRYEELLLLSPEENYPYQKLQNSSSQDSKSKPRRDKVSDKEYWQPLKSKPRRDEAPAQKKPIYFEVEPEDVLPSRSDSKECDVTIGSDITDYTSTPVCIAQGKTV